MTKFYECMYCGKEPEILVDDLISHPVGKEEWDPEVLYSLERCQCGGLERVTVARQSLPRENTTPEYRDCVATLLTATDEFLNTYAGSNPTGVVRRMKAAVAALKAGQQGGESA